MRPLKLTMQAFGPYANKEVIDFTVLGNRTMFVISGKTGSGKTTIFDGISFAIYGKASGEDRNGTELRSQFAPDSVLTEVSLEFKLKDKHYMITRSPQQNKKKDRGEGFTTIGAKAELFMFDEAGKLNLVASSVRDVDEKIKGIMQIDSNQFRQILMIPQGEFRKLLISDSKEKESILQRLFHTELYKKMEETLKEQAGSLKKKVEQHVFIRTSELANIKSIFIEELKSSLEKSNDNDIAILPMLELEIKEMKKKGEELSSRVAIKQKERDRLNTSIFEAEALLKQMKLRDELKIKKMELEAKEKQYQEKEKIVLFAQKAELLTKQEEVCHHLKRQIDKNELEQKKINETLSLLEERLKKAEVIYQQEKEKEDERKQIEKDIAYLKSIFNDVMLIAEKEESVTNSTIRLNNYQKEKQNWMQKLEEVCQHIVSLSERIKSLEAKRLTFLENKEKILQLQYTLEKLKKLEQNMQRYELQKKKTKEIKDVFEQITLRYQDGKSLFEKLENDWLAAQSYFLASKLKNEEACPVCGSTHHPLPALMKRDERIPTEKDLKSAKYDLSNLEKEKSSAESAWIQANSNLQFYIEEKESSLAEVKTDMQSFSQENMEAEKSKLLFDWNTLKSEQIDLEKSIQEKTGLEKELVSQEKNQNVYTQEIEKINNEIQQTRIKLVEAETAWNDLKNRIPEDLRNAKQFQQILDGKIEKLNEMEKIWIQVQENLQTIKENMQKEMVRKEEIEKQCRQLTTNLQAERKIFLDRMKEEGFATYTMYTDSKLPNIEIESMLSSIQDFKGEYRSIRDRLQDLEAVLAEVKKPDIQFLQEDLNRINQNLIELQQEHTNLLFLEQENERIYNKVCSINEEIKEMEESYKVVGHLYDISRGQNTYRITFERYVLASFLDDILEEANGRLVKMTSGRYQLIRKKDRSKGNVQSGLELLIYDQYTGQERHVKTLSGGESFKAALALALGLADVVQQYAGGVSLETMFIDEGFGTLDPESLEQAIETLMDIQNSGRLVGIISHVPELKERIEVRLEVISGQEGSTTKFNFL